MFTPQQNYSGMSGYPDGFANAPACASSGFDVVDAPTLPADTGLGAHVDVGYKKEIARQLLDALDEDSLWRLAQIMQTRGLMGPSPFQSGDQSQGSAGSQAQRTKPVIPVQQPAATDGWYYPPADNSSPVLRSPPQIHLQTQEFQRRPAQQHLPIGAAPLPIGASPSDHRLLFTSIGPATGVKGDNSKASIAKNNPVQTLDAADADATTMIIRNLPPSFDQVSTQSWLETIGYGDSYDFFLWFPAKANSRRVSVCGYAFVNFRYADAAQKFRDKMHLHRFPPEVPEPSEDGSSLASAATSPTLPLNVSVAKVQGFQENWERFHHLLESDATTRCSPFFAPGALESLTKDADLASGGALLGQPMSGSAVVDSSSTPPPMSSISSVIHSGGLDVGAGAAGNSEVSEAKSKGHEGPFSTVVIRNLPDVVDSQPAARHWLNSMGFANTYDYFLFFPAKRVRRLPGSGSQDKVILQNYAYAFVNFKDADMAQRCSATLQGWRPRLCDTPSLEEQEAKKAATTESDPGLNIVAARVQGYQACFDHFNLLEKSGRCVPWLDAAASAKAIKSRYQ